MTTTPESLRPLLKNAVLQGRAGFGQHADRTTLERQSQKEFARNLLNSHLGAMGLRELMTLHRTAFAAGWVDGMFAGSRLGEVG